jgi:uncharacterized protein
MHPSIAKHTDEIIALCKKYGVLKLEIFGSGARGVDFDEDRSDVDLIARFDYVQRRQNLAEFFNFSDDLEKIVGRKVDLSEDVPIKNPYLKRSIDASRELIYAA